MRVAITNPARHDAAARAAPFLAFTRALIAAGGNGVQARAALEHSNDERLRLIAKASVDPGRTDGATWGSQVAELQPAAQAFVETTRQRTLLGRVAGFRPAPFNARVPTQTAASSVGWTAQGAPTQVSAIGFDETLLEHSKVSGIIVVSRELAQLSDPDAQRLIDLDLTLSTAAFLDQAFLDPALAAAGDAPASITYGAPEIGATGGDEAALKADIDSLVGALEDAGSGLDQVVIAMSARQAGRIAAMPCGQRLTIAGGTLCGFPVEVVPTAAVRDTGSSPLIERIVAIDPSRILLADGGVDVSATQAGTVQMETAPDSPATASTVQVSLWQNGLVAVKIVRYVRWEAAGGGAAAYISGARYAAA